MCHPAAPIEMKRRSMLVHSVRRVPPPKGSSSHRISKPPQLYSTARERSSSSPCLPSFRWCWLIQAVEVACERIDVNGPEPAERSQPGIHLLKQFWLQPVETALCVHRGFHETGLAQHAQMLCHGRLRHTKLTLDLSHPPLGRAQEAQYRAAPRLRHDGEPRFHS